LRSSSRKTRVHKQGDVKSDVGVEKRTKSPALDAQSAVADLAARLACLPPEVLAALHALFSGTYMARAQAARASNYLLESVGQKELITAIENGAAGKVAAGSGAFAKVTASMAARDTRAVRDAGVTPREAQVLRHIALGLSNDETARSLEISIETVKEHVQNIPRKLKVRDRTQVAVSAVKASVV
jgi:DNA-binding NarL/FixJ family response regulator